MKLLFRILLLPLIAGISYEFLKLSGKMRHNWLVHAIISPGLLIERLAVREPDKAQLEVAVKAMNASLKN